MTCTLSFDVSDEVARQIIEDIEDALEEGDTWTFEGDFKRENAEQLKTELELQLRHDSYDV